MNRAYRLAGLARQAAKAVSTQHSAITASSCNLLPCQVSCFICEVSALVRAVVTPVTSQVWQHLVKQHFYAEIARAYMQRPTFLTAPLTSELS